MSDDTEMVPSRRVEISANFIRQAYEHIEHTNERYVTFLFVADTDICFGISTAIARPLRVQPTLKEHIQPEAAPIGWTIDTLTQDVVLDVIRTSSPIDTRHIGNVLGIPGVEGALRQKIRRLLINLVEAKLIRNISKGGFGKYVPIKSDRMPLRPIERTITRNDITQALVLQTMREAGKSITSRTIGDMIGIPRPDALVRSKITEHMGKLQREGYVQQDGLADGGRLYRLIELEVETPAQMD